MLHQVANILNAKPPFAKDIPWIGVSIDSRTLQQHNLFFAIHGDHFDGHQFIAQVCQKGAAGAVVEQINETVNLPQIKVDDVRHALGRLAKVWLMDKTLKKIAITGSVGKTSVKEMVASILRCYCHNDYNHYDNMENASEKYNKYLVIATQGNLNNDLGVPLTVFNVQKETQFGVFELGANHQGEIAYTADIVQPNIALINNVAGAHLEGFGSIEGVSKAKSEIYAALDQSGTAIINIDDQFADDWLAMTHRIGCHVVTYSLTKTSARIYAKEIELGLASTRFVLCVTDLSNQSIQEIPIVLSLLGEHNCRNALAAAAICLSLSIPLTTIQQGFLQMTGVKGRLVVSRHTSGALLIDDTYNANGASVKAAIDVLANQAQQQNKHSILILGKLAELGESEQAVCRDIANYAQQKNIDQLWVVGEQASLYLSYFDGAFSSFTDITAAQSALSNLVVEQGEQLVILVKGSRSARMERVFSQLNEVVL